MNLLNQQLKAIQTTKATLQKQLKQTKNPHTKQKLEHQIHCLTMEEKDTLNQLNIRLNDIELTEEDE